MRELISLLIGICLSVVVVPCRAEPPAALARSIERFSAGAHALLPSEMDTKACAPLGENPSAIRADFDGDGRDDFAVLLMLGDTGKETEWNGARLKQARIALVFFLAEPNGEFKPRVAHRFLSYVPVPSILTLLSPSEIPRSKGTTDLAAPDRAAVGLAMCEKSATAYYISGANRLIKSIPLLD